MELICLTVWFYRHDHHQNLPSFPTRLSSNQLHAEGHDATRVGRHKTLAAGGDESKGIANDVIGGECQNDRVTACRQGDRKSTRLKSSHVSISYADFYLQIT